MNKIIISLIFIFGVGQIMSQNINDALRYSSDNVEGSARFSAMSGAFGALGGELSAISINPAGSAIYNKGVVSLSFSNNSKLLSPPPTLLLLLLERLCMVDDDDDDDHADEEREE